MVDTYNNLIKKYAAFNNLDPALVFSQIKQESNGDPNALSSVGAIGLMQLMPSSFNDYLPDELKDPETNIKVGTAFLRECIGIFKDETGNDQIRFGLAAYNAGVRNIVNAQKMAATLGYPTSCWASVGVALVNVTGISNAMQTNWYVHVIMRDAATFKNKGF